MILLISAGRGPDEARRFVALLADQLVAAVRADGGEIRPLGSESASLGDACHGSLRFQLDGRATALAAAWSGVHLLRELLRGAGQRQRWFIEVSLHVPAAVVLQGPVRLQASRAGGPGGQNVNKRATAIRAVDAVSGLAVRVSGERSQAQNRRRALELLQNKRDERDRLQQAEAERTQHHQHDRLRRGEPAFTWRLGRDGKARRDP